MDPPKRPPPPPASFVPSAPFHGAAASIDLRKQAISASAVKSQNWGLEALVEEAAAAAGCTPHVTSSRGAAGGGTPDWSAYWDGKHTVELPDRHGRFNVYTAGSTGPVVLCIHGGGYTGLTWSLVAPLLKSKYRVVAPDLRGHGETTTSDDGDLSAATLAADVGALWQHLFRGPGADRVPTVLVGHSMGGAVAVWAAAGGQVESLDGLVVIDVVEGTALAALPFMVGVINGRPTSFRSAQEAVSWALRTGMSKNAAAAAVSIPSQLLPQSQVSTLQQQPPSSSSSGQAPPPPVFGAPRAADAAASSSSSLGVIAEAGASSSEAGASPWGAPPLPSSSAGAPPLVWRTPLLQTHKFWTGWYQGLSAAFLKCPAPKMLLLAGTDRLDKELTIGQMQGRFQLQVMPQAGHAIHEDEPLKAAEHLLAFLKRFRIGEPPMVLPRAPPGMRPVLPVAAGPLLAAAAAAPPPATAADPRSR